MKWLTYVFVIITFFACNNGKRKLIGNSDFQKKMNATFKDASESPLTKKDLKRFKGLEFFPINNKYKVIATLTKSNDNSIFKFPTTTDRIVEYYKYGIVTFNIDEKPFSLAIFKSVDAYGDLGKYGNDLFLPFHDKTNGITSYKGGRFIELKIFDVNPDNTLVIDFNKAYNPYCAYNKKYSCPITPKENTLNIDINAGVMKYKK